LGPYVTGYNSVRFIFLGGGDMLMRVFTPPPHPSACDAVF